MYVTTFYDHKKTKAKTFWRFPVKYTTEFLQYRIQKVNFLVQLSRSSGIVNIVYSAGVSPFHTDTLTQPPHTGYNFRRICSRRTCPQMISEQIQIFPVWAAVLLLPVVGRCCNHFVALSLNSSRSKTPELL